MLSYVAPLGLAFEGGLLYVGFRPTLVYIALTGLAWCVCRVFVGASPYACFISPLRGWHGVCAAFS